MNKTVPLPVPWSRMQSWRLRGLGSFINPPAMRSYVALEMIMGDQVIFMYPVGLS